jgi:hypothetical protein
LQEHNTIIGNLLTEVNRNLFNNLVTKYNGDRYTKNFNCWTQFVCILIAQILGLESLRDIAQVINFQPNQHYHLGIKKNISKSTLADANKRINYCIFRDLFLILIKKLPNAIKFKTQNLIKIIDSSPIRLNLLKCPWGEKTQRIEGIKLHLLYDLSNKIPTYFEFTGARCNDVEVGKKMKIKSGCTYVFDKGYMDFNWWNSIDEKGAFFVTRLKKNNAIIEKSEIKQDTKEISSQLIQLKTKRFKGGRYNYYSDKILRKVIVKRENKTDLVLVTNDFKRSSEEIGELYKQRWSIELFFKWIKQNLKIKKFLGTSENAVKTQICIALISYVLIHLMNNKAKEIFKGISMKTLLKILANNLFRKLKSILYDKNPHKDPKQLHLQSDLSP